MMGRRKNREPDTETSRYMDEELNKHGTVMAYLDGKQAREDDCATSHDPVNHPAHYTSSAAACRSCGEPIECIDVVRHMSFTIGNVVKYLWREALKGNSLEDLHKASWYLNFEIAQRELKENK